MKKILSIILAISLILTFLPSFAYAETTETTTESLDLAKTQTLTFGEGGITELIQNTASSMRYTASITDGALVLDDIQTRAMGTVPYSSYTAYAAIEFTAESSGLFELKFKTDNATQTSADVAVHMVEKSLCPVGDYTLSDGKAVPAYFIGQSYTSTYKVGRFDFSAATNGVYKNVTNNGVSTRVELQKGTDYYLLIYCDPETKTVAESTEGKTYMYGSYPSQHVYLSGIQFEPVSEMNFNSSVLTTVDGEKLAPENWAVSGAAGWTVNTELSRGSAYQSQSVTDELWNLSFARNSSYAEPWSSFGPNSSNNIKAKQQILTLKTGFVLDEGYYRIKVKGGKYYLGTQMGIYVDEKFAGWYDCFDETATKPTLDAEEEILNTVYLTPDENGTVNVFIAPEGAVYNKGNKFDDDDALRTYAVLSKITFEYLGKEKPASAIADKIVLETADSMKAGNEAELSAYVLMSDGSKRHISGMKRTETNKNGYTLCAQSDSDDYIKIETTDNLVFDADFEGRNVASVFTNADGYTTGILTAAAGNGNVTVSAKVDGEEVTAVSQNISVADDGVSLGILTNYIEAESGVVADGYAVNEKATVSVGTTVTAEAKDIDGYKFAYWKDGSRFLSLDNKITVTVARNTALTAVYDVVSEESTEAKIVEFWNADKTLLSRIEAEGDTVALPENDPTMAGYNFIGWYTDEETEFTSETVLTADITRVVAQYEKVGANQEVYVGTTLNTVKYDEVISLIGSDKFGYWILNNRIVSFNKNLDFHAYNGAALLESTSYKTPIPTIVLDEDGGSFFIAYETPAEYERIETGIIFGTSAGITVNSAYSKASAKNTAAFGQFTAKPMNTETYARGYQIFKKDGSVHVIYTDAIAVQ